MKNAKRYLAVLVCAALVTVSCGREATTAPGGEMSNDLLGGTLGTVTGTLKNVLGTLLKCNQLPYAANRAIIGSAGGTLTVGPHTLVVPRGALSGPTLISAEAPRDNNRTVSFSPEGLRFAKPASLTMSYSGCSLVVGLLPRIAYTSDNLVILSYVPSINNLFGQTVTGQLQHFSRYAAAW